MGFKDLKREYIIDYAKKMFLSRSISEITIKDISSVSGIGEATIYRYFSTKENLAIAVSVSIQKELVKAPITDSNKNGLEQIRDFYSLFRTIFVNNRSYFKFISEFDSLYLKQIKGSEYSLSLDVFFDMFMNSYNLGLKDGSVKKNKNISVFYYTSTHSLLELCKKLASIDSPLKQDKAINKLDEIECLIDIFISVLKA
ncbi:MAG: TetR/AcrR family transcriptional regulator [Bacilli bacterium]|nr:TetR/AcrR family transcriptional regulator [Bacilli bacterium]